MSVSPAHRITNLSTETTILLTVKGMSFFSAARLISDDDMRKSLFESDDGIDDNFRGDLEVKDIVHRLDLVVELVVGDDDRSNVHFQQPLRDIPLNTELYPIPAVRGGQALCRIRRAAGRAGAPPSMTLKLLPHCSRYVGGR